VLIDARGHYVGIYGSSVTPDAPTLRQAIDAALSVE